MKKRSFILTLTLFYLAFSFSLLATPKNIIITRHADKPPHKDCLSLQGLERAAALAYYFSKTPAYNNPPIAHIFAAHGQGSNPSIRPVQTCTPVAKLLRLPLNSSFHEVEVDKAAHEILTNPKYHNSTILVCWDHYHIPSFIKALGGEDVGKWEDNVFDQVYMLTYETGNKPKIQKFLQQLMYGDRTTFEDIPHPNPPIPVTCPDEVK